MVLVYETMQRQFIPVVTVNVYHIAEKFGKDFNLAVWQILKKLPKFLLNFHQYYVHVPPCIYCKCVKWYLIMSLALYTYLRKEFPTPCMCGDFSSLGQDVELTNKAVELHVYTLRA